jgi:ankyrin repeat protein
MKRCVFKGAELLTFLQSETRSTAKALELIAEGADPMVKDATYAYNSLVAACMFVLPEVVLAILAIPGIDVNASGERKITPLMYACNNNFREIVTILVEKGADVNTIDGDGWTALNIAIFRSNVEIALQLIAAGADVNVGKRLPLSACEDKPELAAVIAALLAAGATA